MEDEIKNLIKNVNDGNMLGTKENFDNIIANKIYDRLEQRKEELSQTLFNQALKERWCCRHDNRN